MNDVTSTVMPTSFFEQSSYCSLNSCAHCVALLFKIVRQLQKDSNNVTAAATESPITSNRIDGYSSPVSYFISNFLHTTGIFQGLK